jgi:hypothetical protein
MDRRTRGYARIALIAFSSVWVFAFGWLLFGLLPAEEIQTHSSPVVRERLQDECRGTFQQRYECKEAIVLEVSQTTFANLSLRLLVVCLGPILSTIGFIVFCKPDAHRQAPVIHDDMAWKHAAERHVAAPSPPPSSNRSDDDPAAWH